MILINAGVPDVPDLQTTVVRNIIEPGITFAKFVTFADNVTTTETCCDKWEDILMARAFGKTVEEEDADDGPPNPVFSGAKMSDIINDDTCIDFAMFHGNC